MKKQLIVMSFLFGVILNFYGCTENKIDAKNMEQIYKEEGVPVRVEKITANGFVQEFNYNAVLTGVEETSSYAMVSDRIEKINVSVGAFVKKNQVLLTFPTDNPGAKYYQTRVAFENSQKNVERYKTLYEAGGVSKQDYDNILTQFEVDKANWDAVQQTIEVKAPISGYVTEVAVRETDYVKRDQLLVTISNTLKVKAKINVSENEIDQLNVGQKAEAVWNGKSVKGKLVQVDLAMNPKTKSFNAVAEFDNSKKEMRAGVTADITIKTKGDGNSIVTERKNLVRSGNKYYLFVLDDGTAKKREAKIGKTFELYAEIVAGLHEGDNLVTEGQLLLDDNSKVKVIN